MTRANRLATQAAARRFAQRYLPQELSPPHIRITHRADGKPLLYGTLPAAVHLSLSHSAGASVALLAQEPLGIDLEVVACRTCETWRALLAMDGYALALRIQVHTGESFDCAATRVWTMLEIARKADLPRPTMSAVRIDTGADTLTLNAGTQGENYISLLLQHPTDASISAALTLTISDRQDINY